MSLYASIDGTCILTEKQLIQLVMKAYKRTALIPSRGIWGFNHSFASASGAMIKAFGEFPQVTQRDWIDGFDLGFETIHSADLLTYGQTKGFIRGFTMGQTVAIAIFNWSDSPNILI